MTLEYILETLQEQAIADVQAGRYAVARWGMDCICRAPYQKDNPINVDSIIELIAIRISPLPLGGALELICTSTDWWQGHEFAVEINDDADYSKPLTADTSVAFLYYPTIGDTFNLGTTRTLKQLHKSITEPRVIKNGKQISAVFAPVLGRRAMEMMIETLADRLKTYQEDHS